MKEEINLLPSDVIKKRTKSIYMKRLGRIGRFFMIALVLVNLSLIAINFSLRDSLKVLTQEKVVVDDRQTNTVTDQVNDLNKVSSAVYEKTQDYDPWLPLLKDVVDLKPNNASMVSVSLEEQENATQTLSLEALSSSRSEAVAWQKSLENLPWVSKLEAPLQNFATGPNTTFTFTLFRGEE